MKKTELSIILLALGVIIVFGILYFSVESRNPEFEKAKIDALNGDFVWISNLVYSNYSYSLNDFKEKILSKNYTDRDFYNVFNELSFRSTTPEVSCIEKKETPRCIFFNAILTNNEELCKNFPEEKEETITGKYGSSKRIAYYQDSCILYTQIYDIYLNSNDKIKFCNSFEEDYIKEQCLFYLETPQRDFSTLR